jgi:hypothetical protein
MMIYPKTTLELGGADSLAAADVVSALLARGHNLQAAWKAYDTAVTSVAKLLQGRPDAQAPGLPVAAMAHAVSQLGVAETAAGDNVGPEIEAYLASVGLEAGYAWRAAFVHWCFGQAADAAMVRNPFPRTAGSLDAWNMTPAPRRISRAKAILNPELVRPGLVFVVDLGAGAGHAGFVRRVMGGALTTIECALDPRGGDGAFGVFELTRRTVMDRTLKGFLDFG